jgi:hypothetical protein
MEGELIYPCVSRLAHGQMVYASPAVNDMLNQKGTEFEGKDFFDLVFGQSFLLRLQLVLTSSTRPASTTERPHILGPANTSTTPPTKFKLSQHRFKFSHTADTRQQYHI